MGAGQPTTKRTFVDLITARKIQDFHREERELMQMIDGKLDYMRKPFLEYLEKIKEFCAKNKHNK